MIRPQYILPLARELTVDLFAGGGGASTGIEQALGRHVDIAVNHDAQAVSLHQRNHPQTRHFCSDVFEVDPITVTDGQPIGLLWASPDCFPAGTLVLSDRGYRAIESLRVGERVLSHKGQWRRITETSSAVRPIVTLRGHGHPALRVSPEHPFLTRQDQRDLPQWRKAGELEKGMYWATPRQFPVAGIPPVPGRGIAADARLMWLAGRYVGDGWTRLTDTRAELVITCNKLEAAGLRLILEQWPRAGARARTDELAWHERETRTATQFSTSNRGLVTWLREHFGHRAEAKGLPAWALGLEPRLRQALLDGYVSADGHRRATFIEATTVSKALAFSVKALVNSLGKTVGVYTGANSTVIEGRKVNARPVWRLRWRHQVDAAHQQTFGMGLHEWTPIRARSAPAAEERVFNIGVAVDESYVVEGIVVHNCKHFSKAKGGKPVSKKVRGLAWVVTKWAKLAQPRVICLENVEEFKDWGPLDANNMPCQARKGHTFKRWVRTLVNLGYTVEHRELRACDYGAPTIRKRLFLVARNDGVPIVWPAPTHSKTGASGLKKWRTAAECIDWVIPVPSIFERKKPLAEATMRRIAHGIQRYVIDAAKPFIVPITHTTSNRASRSVDDPPATITTARGGELALVSAHLTKFRQNSIGSSMHEPVPTVTANSYIKRPGGSTPLGLVSATLAQIGYGERLGQAPRASNIEQPLGTVVGAKKHAVVAATLIKHFGGEPGDGKTHASMENPLPAVTARDHSSIAAATLVKLRGTSNSAAVTEPLGTVTAGGQHHAAVYAFLLKYFGTDQDPRLEEPMHTATTKQRFALVTVDKESYYIADIGLRMLKPRELFNAQSFPRDYEISHGADGAPITQEAQIRMCGNSVAPVMAKALVAANYVEEVVRRAA